MARVLEVIGNYRNGTYRADVSLLRGVFHEKAAMNGYLGSEPLVSDPEPFIADIGGAPSMESAGDPYRAEVEFCRIEGNVASVILSETGFRGSASLVDFFHLIRIDGQWKIIAKLFTTV
jgi:hypothetical protein